MAILQIIYLAINVISIIVALIYYIGEAETTIFSDLFTFIHKHFKKVGVFITAFVLISILLPTIAFMSALTAFIMIYGTYID